MYKKIYKRQTDSNASSLTPYIFFDMNNHLISEAPEYSQSYSTNHDCIAWQMAAPVAYYAFIGKAQTTVIICAPFYMLGTNTL